MFIYDRADVPTVPAATPSISGTSIPEVPIDHTPISAFGMFILQFYAFGGLAFMVAIILSAITYWIWTVVIKREYADSPPELELHPERMRQTEKDRIERYKARKEEKRRRRNASNEKDQMYIPPLRYQPKDWHGRERSSSLPTKPIMQNCASASNNDTKDRKSSLSTTCSAKGGKRVSWASSTSTLDVNGHSCQSPLTGKASLAASLKEPEIGPGTERKTYADAPVPVFTTPEYGSGNVPTAAPKALLTSVHRRPASIEPRSRRGRDMIAATTADHAASWATQPDYASNPPLPSRRQSHNNISNKSGDEQWEQLDRVNVSFTNPFGVDHDMSGTRSQSYRE
ncbi:hypothetical protein D9613_011483 [Agrocybe pediades]|uniref:Uncharacterized protein n=1 Tax=Agrocybe pediades TaxID=84607 RepID=A0A8H4VMH2_9AGAR|nr:hypothetical protein D9613_011483 [Agrocybe pediades]